VKLTIYSVNAEYAVILTSTLTLTLTKAREKFGRKGSVGVTT